MTRSLASFLRCAATMSSQDIEYSEKYYDDDFEYRSAEGAFQTKMSMPCCSLLSGAHHACRLSLSSTLPCRSRIRSHVILPKHVAKNAPKGRLLSESEWRGLGVQQSRGWVHYAIHRPEPHILLFRRPQGTDPTTGLVYGKRIDPATGKIVG